MTSRRQIGISQLANSIPSGCVFYLNMETLNTSLKHPVTLPDGVHLRPATSADLGIIADLLTAAHPDHPTSVEGLQRRDDSRVPSDILVRLLAERGVQLVGLAETSTPRMDGHPGWLSIEIAVLPSEIGGPLPGALLALAEANALAHGAHTLVARVHEHWWELPFLQAHGYTEHDRMWRSVLDLRTLNFDQFAAQEATALATGVQLRPLSDLGEFDEALQRRLYDLIAAVLRDVPSTTPVSVWDFETWQFRVAAKIKHPEGILLAVAPDGELVGLSELHLPDPARPGMLHNGLTGVKQGWRGHHLGLALKLAAARAGLARGYTHSRTGNHSVNRPMLAINDAMGFVREAAVVTVKKGV